MKNHVNADLRVTSDFEAVLPKLRVADPEDVEQARRLWEQVRAVARPKYLYRVVDIHDVDENGVRVEDVRFKSKILAQNFQDVHRAYAHVVTCGAEIAQWSRTHVEAEEDDLLAEWMLDKMMEQAMDDAREALYEHLRTAYGLAKVSSMNPGSGNLDTWPIEQQRDLFNLLGDVTGEIGVVLTDSYLMTPAKTISGIAFTAEHDFHTCALCTREDCVGRKAPYDPNHMLQEA